MRNILKKIWFPVVVVSVAAIQTFGMDISRNTGFRSQVIAEAPDTVIYVNNVYSGFRTKGDKAAADSLEGFLEEIGDTTFISARDTMKVPDSLRLTDPFRYRYYVAIKDSLTHVIVRDSLRAAGDSIDWPKLDSLYFADSTLQAKIRFEKWYNSLDKQSRKRYDYEQKMKRQQHMADSIMAIKDSLRAIRDSIRENTPRILSAYAIPDSMQYKRVITWNRDKFFSKLELHPLDTGFNYWFHDYPFTRKDINVTYLGPAGSPVQYYDFFKRGSVEGVSFYEPLEAYAPSPSTLTMYNTKTPYTELAYWGTLLANTDRSEDDVHVLTTQNITPELNLALSYDRFGAAGMLDKERTDNKVFSAYGNYLGKRYTAHFGYIYNKVRRQENGGLTDSFFIRDTTLKSREIPIMLKEANSVVVKNTVFLDQTYRIPLTFIKDLLHAKDTSYKKAAADSLVRDVTTAFIGHSSEYSTFRRIYTDKISQKGIDTLARHFYHDNFFINPVQSYDSTRVMKLENKVFIRLQPWAQDAVVSTVDAGIGNRILSHYLFTPDSYLYKPSNTVWNSTYIYGGAGGRILDNVSWNADGYYTFLGEEINDFGISADARMDIYPFRRHRKSPLSFSAHFETSLKEPDFYLQHYYSNHFKWENDFSKISLTKIEGRLEVPHLDFAVEAGYSLLNNNTYYDTLGIVRQNTTPMHVAKVAVTKNFTLGPVHLDNRALFQVSSKEDVLPLPKLALNARWYVQFNIVRPEVMRMQIGADVSYTTKWYAPAYNPATGQFYNQTSEKFGDCPYIDAFVNVQWKRACVFIKMINVGMGWPNDSADYFSAAGYIRPQRALKFGVWWPFYTQTRKHGKASDRLSTSGK
ncbi:MAG: putative porin [Candidatus Cryptobacteroides sp.]|jgi:hypothetical protein|nr:putative porin [Bacteroidales bacterium]MBQ2526882.1 putative porin [Bacteroidales bacterium]MBQ3996952.1 putative porin [Bacteroidales bacterium]MEE3406549.1 putative porin [Candidatus Cryptobacteroides sp.]